MSPRVVGEGDSMVIAVQGGFVRRPVPGPGLLWDLPEGDRFVPLADVGALVDAARALPAKKARAR